MTITRDLLNVSFASCTYRAQDLYTIIEAVKNGFGVTISPAEACTIWEWYSSQMDAGWLMFDDDPAARQAEICGVLEDFMRTKLQRAVELTESGE